MAGAEFAANIVTYFKLGCFDVPVNIKPCHTYGRLASKSLWRHRFANLILSVTAVASFALNVVIVRYGPSFAFYLSLTPFWEFLAGTAARIRFS